MTDGMARSSASAAFEAVLYPNQPPPARSVVVLLAGVFGVAIAVSIGFFIAGAWPVIGFIGIELALFAGCLVAARRTASYAEHIRLDDTGLHIKTTTGRRILRSWRFEPYWVRVRLDEVRPGEPVIRLAAHGHSLTIGRCLNAKERTDVAAALKSALDRYRTVTA